MLRSSRDAIDFGDEGSCLAVVASVQDARAIAWIDESTGIHREGAGGSRSCNRRTSFHSGEGAGRNVAIDDQGACGDRCRAYVLLIAGKLQTTIAGFDHIAIIPQGARHLQIALLVGARCHIECHGLSVEVQSLILCIHTHSANEVLCTAVGGDRVISRKDGAARATGKRIDRTTARAVETDDFSCKIVAFAGNA